MKTFDIELVTNEIVTNNLAIDAETLERRNHNILIIDGIIWELPEGIGLSFARVTDEDGLEY
jgi:hypothetical protein